MDPTCSLVRFESGIAKQGSVWFSCPSSPPRAWGLAWPCPKGGRNPKISLSSWFGSSYWAGGGCCGFCQMKVLVGYWFCWAWRGCLIPHQPCISMLSAQRGPEELSNSGLFVPIFYQPSSGYVHSLTSPPSLHPGPAVSPACAVTSLCSAGSGGFVLAASPEFGNEFLPFQVLLCTLTRCFSLELHIPDVTTLEKRPSPGFAISFPSGN